MGGARRALWTVLFALASLLAAPFASATEFYGVGPHCNYPTIQAAINALIANDHTFNPAIYYTTIAVAANTFHESLEINSGSISWPDNPLPYQGAVLQIVGGYDQTCDNPDPNVAPGSTVIDASGQGGSGLWIHGSSYAYVILSNLSFVNANNTSGAATGGGINFTGQGRLDISEATIYNNQASFGAGIFASGSGAGIALTLYSGTTIQHNFARNAGGGMRIEGKTHLLALEPSIYIFDNTANTNSSDGTGGGIQIYGSGQGSVNIPVADIGSPGLNGAAVIDTNHAHNGGGIAVQNFGGLRLFSTVVGLPATIANNTAANQGAGIYVDSAKVCGSGYAINANSASREGSGLYVKGPAGSSVLLSEADLVASETLLLQSCGFGYALPSRSACPVGASCNQIDGNQGSLSTVDVEGTAVFLADRFEMRRNFQFELLRSTGRTSLQNCLIAENNNTNLIENAGAAILTINGCTLARNTLFSTGSNPGNALIQNTGQAAALYNSIIALNAYQNAIGATTAFPAGSVYASDVIGSEINSLLTGISYNVNADDPGFIDPVGGNYHLRTDSPAVDYHRNPLYPLTAPYYLDLDGQPRGLGLLIGSLTPYDIGAYELQGIPICGESDKIFCSEFDPL